MQPSPRKEVIQLSGLTILFIIALVANLLIVGFAYRYHNYQMFLERKTHNLRLDDLLAAEHKLKLEIVALEGVKTWNDTRYIHELGK